MTEWSDWSALGNRFVFTPAVLEETLDGGQAFRWTRPNPPETPFWVGVWSNHVARLRLAADGTLEASVPNGRANTLLALDEYLGGKVDWPALADTLPWRSDPHLQRCITAFPGLRLLSQSFREALLAFLCSATKQIPQIKIMCRNLAEALGSEIAPGFRALPSWPQLAEASETELRSLGLGFRAKNIKRSADLIASTPQLLDEIEAAPYFEAKILLMSLPGVGEKIADCALLFGGGKFEAFPVDTWIIKTLALRYALDGWTNSQLAQFGRVHFGQHAGYAQQFLFAYERAQAKAARATVESLP